MIRLIPRSSAGPRPPQVALTLPPPAVVPPDLPKQADEAAGGRAPAPQLEWTSADLAGPATLEFLDQSLDVTAGLRPIRLCAVGVGGSPSGNDLTLGIASGVVTIDAPSLAGLAGLAAAVWPPDAEARFGKLTRIVVGPQGLDVEADLEVASAHTFRRFRLVTGAADAPAAGEALLAWRQVPWRDANMGRDQFKDPADRLGELRRATETRLAVRVDSSGRAGPPPATIVERFDPRGEVDSAVFLVVRRTSGGVASMERVVPTWSLSIGGADWSPRSLAVGAGPLDSAALIYSDGDDPFDLPASADPSRLTRLRWSWTADAPPLDQEVRPRLELLASDPPLLTTGEMPGSGANSPFLWQVARLGVGPGGAERSEAGAWVRYRLDPLPERASAASREPDDRAGLSRPIRVERLRRVDGTDEPWRLDLGLLPEPGSTPARARIWFEPAPGDATGAAPAFGARLVLDRARVRAATPPLLTLRTPLADPGALPNRADQRPGLHPETRILLANDREAPTGGLARGVGLEATLDKSTGAVRVSARGGARDAAVAYVAGPMAGLDQVPHARGNLVPKPGDIPGPSPTSAPPDRVRQYEPGRVAVHLIRNVDLRSSKEPLGVATSTVRLDSVADLFLPRSRGIAALLPWASWRIEADGFDAVALEPFHRNLAVESLDWAAGAPDRHDPAPHDLPPMVDFRDEPEGSPRDFSREESLASLERAVRDRFARASTAPITQGTPAEVANWLPGVAFRSPGGAAITPRVGLDDVAGGTAGTGRRALRFSWDGAASADRPADQRLGLVPSPAPEAAPPWMATWLRWVDEAPDRPTLAVDLDGRAGGRRSSASDVPLLEHRGVVSAVASGWLAGRLWVFFAVESTGHPRLFAWEPMAGDDPAPIALDGPAAIPDAPVTLLTVDAGTNTLALAVVQGATCTVLSFKAGGPGPVGTLKSLTSVPLPGPITAARLAATRLFVGTGSTGGSLFVFRVDGGTPLPEVHPALHAGPVHALDVRALPGGGSLLAAVATGEGAASRVKLYRWELAVNAEPTHAPDHADASKRTPVLDPTDPSLAAPGTLTAVALQPLAVSVPPIPTVEGAFVYAAVRQADGRGRVAAWRFATIDEGGNLPPLPATTATGGALQDRTLRGAGGAIVALLADPVLNDSTTLPSSPGADDGSPRADWIVAVSEATPDGASALSSWPVVDWLGSPPVNSNTLPTFRPLLGRPTRSAGHAGAIASAAVVPGRAATAPGSAPDNGPDSRFAARVVTGGADGTVRLWDPETGEELARRAFTRGGAWMDVLGVVRTPLVPATEPGFWVEPASLPDPATGARRLVLRLSTLGGPIDLVHGTDLASTGTDLRFLCLDIPLSRAGAAGPWTPLALDESDPGSHAIRHGVFGCADVVGGVPKLLGVPIELVAIGEVEFDEPFSSWPEAGRSVLPRSLSLRAVLCNPSEATPDGSTARIVDPGAATILLKLARDGASTRFAIDLGPASHFDWRFPLAQQVPLGDVSILPGRLDRLEGDVAIDRARKRLKLTPSTGSRAEALGRTRELIDPPALVADPDPGDASRVRFREAPDEAKLEPLGNPLPRPGEGEVVADVACAGPSGDPAVLIAAQPKASDEPGAALLADLGSGRELARYGAGFRKLRVCAEVVEPGKAERLVGVAIADDGTVRIHRLWDAAIPAGSFTLEEADREISRHVLPSPAEDVQVFDDSPADGPRRWLLARCRDGSSWLWDPAVGSRRYDLTPPDSAATVVAFAPAVRADFLQADSAHWREAYGRFDPGLALGFDAVAAVGAADGSIRLYAVSNDRPPTLVRTRFLRGEPIRSVCLAIDQKSAEAGVLGRRGESVLRGLVLLACDDAGPPLLVETITDREVVHDPNAPAPPGPAVPDPRDANARANLGILFYDDDALWVVARYAAADGTPRLAALTKRIVGRGNDLRVANELPDVPPGKVTGLVVARSPRPMFAAVVGQDAGWRIYKKGDSGKVDCLKRDDTAVLDASIASVFIPDGAGGASDPMRRYLVAVRPNGAIRTWVQADPSGDAPKWEATGPTSGPANLDNPARVSAAALGRVALPLIACRGRSGQSGFTWSVDLGAAGPAWPAAIGPLDDDTPVAIAGVRGAPHLAVARPSDVTVWDLDSGRLAARIGLDLRPSVVEAAGDLDRLWLLVACDVGANDRVWRIADPLAEASLPEASRAVLRGDPAAADARLIGLPRGLVQVTASVPPAAPPVLRVDVRAPRGAPIAGASVPLGAPLAAPAKSLKVLDVAEAGADLWALLAIDDIPVVVHARTGRACPLRTPAETPVTGAFDLDPDPAGSGRPVVWTINPDGTRIAAWTLSDPDAAPAAPLAASVGPKSFDSPPAGTGRPVTAGVARWDGRTRLVAVATDAVSVWDLDERSLLRSDPLRRADRRLVHAPVSAVILADAASDRVRIWDQATGRLRHRLDVKPMGVKGPDRIACVSSPARPRLVISGGDGSHLAVLDPLGGGFASVALATSPASLDASLDGSGAIAVAAAVADGAAGVVARVWSAPLAEGASLFGSTAIDLSHPVGAAPSSVAAVAFLRHDSASPQAQVDRRLLLATADSGTILVRDLPAGSNALGAGATDAALSVADAGFEITAIRLATGLDPDDECILAGVALKASAAGTPSRVALLDLPLRPRGGMAADRPATSWTTEAPGEGLAAVGGAEGPRLVANFQAFRADAFLRIDDRGKPPLYDLPVRLLEDRDAFLLGRITPGRRLDLRIRVSDPRALGWPVDLKTLTAKAALIQGSYSCFVIEPIDRAELRLSGALILWDDADAQPDQVSGVLLLDDTSLNASAKVDVPGGAAITASGPRVRLRGIPFGPTDRVLEKLPWREVLTWALANAGDVPTRVEWHLAEAVIAVPTNRATLHVARGSLASPGAAPMQGDLILSIERDPDDDAYTLGVVPAVYAAEPVADPAKSDAGTTRDDVVYPAAAIGSVGLSFDLVEPRPPGDPLTLAAPRTPAEAVHLVTPVLTAGEVGLIRFNPENLPFDPVADPESAMPLPRAPIEVPQLVHREAHGGRLRGRWPAATLPVDPPAGAGAPLVDASTPAWLLSPLARTPRGVAALTLSVLVRPGGRALDWTRLQSEVVLAVYREGGALFTPMAEGFAPGLPSVVNLLAGTVRRSGVAADSPASLFDDARVQAHVLRTGATGVLPVRTADARGRASYRFVNSPYYSLIPLASRKTEADESANDSLPRDVADPRLIAPRDVAALTLRGTTRYQPAAPAFDRPESRAFRLAVPGDARSAVRFAEVPALRSADRPDAPGADDRAIAPGATAFVPPAVELAFGPGKPGALFHQVVQCLSGTASAPVASLPTSMARREPQRFTPPGRSSLDFKSATAVRETTSGTLKVSIGWVEVLGSVAVRAAEFVESLKLEADAATPTNLLLSVPKGQEVALWVARLGEQITPLPRVDSPTLPAPLSPLREGRRLDAFDLFLVTRTDLDVSPTGPAGAAPSGLTPMFVQVKTDGSPKPTARPPRPLAQVMERVAATAGGWHVWRLRRSTDAAPDLLAWIDTPPDLRDAGLNVLWLASPTLGNDDAARAAAYDAAPKLYPRGALGLRDVPHEPQSPRLAAAIRLPASSVPGLLAKAREATLFDGPAATAKGVEAKVAPDGDEAVVSFEAGDAEEIHAADPLPKPPPATSSITCGVFLVKMFEDGSTLVADTEIVPTEEVS